MPTFTLDDLVKPVTRQEAQASIYSALAILGVNTTSWKPGAVPRAMIVGVSVVLSAFSQLIALTAKSGFLEYAEDDWLDLVAYHVYGVIRIEATYASGYVTLDNTGGGEYTLDPGDLIVLNPTTGKTYRNTELVELAAGQLGLVVPILATEAGSASSSSPGTITEFATPLLGVECTNAASVVGLDDETDAALRMKCTEKLGALSPMGPWDAYNSAVRNAKRPDGSTLGITRIRTTKDGYGNVTTYVATASGAVPGDVTDPATDLGIANEAIQRAAAPLGVTAYTESAVTVAIPVTYELWIYNTSGRSDAEIQTMIADRLTAFMSGQPIGGNKVDETAPGYVYHDAIQTTIGSTLHEIFRVVVTAPVGDVSVAYNAVPILSGTPVATIHQVPPPEGYGGSGVV